MNRTRVRRSTGADPRLLRWATLHGICLVVALAAQGGHAVEIGAVWVPSLEGAEPYLQARQPPPALIVPVFEEGRATYSTEIELFAPAEEQAVTEEALRAFVKRCHRQKVAVYGALDLLHWVLLGKASDDDLLATHPELIEVNIQRRCNEREEGRFASPFSPEVRELLLQLAREIATKFSALDGLVLNCRLSPSDMLGYSESARVAFILAKSLDPIDLLIYTTDPEEKKYTEEWYRWRLNHVSAFLGEVVDAYRQHCPKGKVLVQAFANNYQWTLRRRASAVQDWLDWVLSGFVDGVLLEADWADVKRNGDAFETAAELVKRTGRRPLVLGLVASTSVTDAKKSQSLKTLESQGCQQVIVRIVPPLKAGERKEETGGTSDEAKG